MRVDVLDVAGWRLPEAQKAALVSCDVPLIDGVVDAVSLYAEPTMYRLAQRDLGISGLRTVYGVVTGSGQVLEVWSSSGSTTFVNSTINHWLCSLHLVGTWLTSSSVMRRWNEDDEDEIIEEAELAELLQRIASLNPPAFGDGDHETHFWPAVFDPWTF